jgi:hypothetical protein
MLNRFLEIFRAWSIKERNLFLGLCLLSLALRMGLSWFSDFGDDSVRLYDQALDFYLFGEIAKEGAKVVYSDTALPGSLQSLLTGIPLWFSSGMPIGVALSLAILNWLAMILTYFILQSLFLNIPMNFLAPWILFSPWSLIHVPIWNPSYLPFLFVLFWLALLKIELKPKDFLSSFSIGLIFILILQLHLSFILLPLFLFLFFLLKRIELPSVKGALLGVTLGTITLIPFLKNKLMIPTDAEKVGSFFFRNIVFRGEIFQDFGIIFSRLLSFPTAEVSRFVGSRRGYSGVLGHLQENLFFIPIFLVAISFSIWLLWKGLRFYWNKNRWKAIFKRGQSDEPMAGMDAWLLTLPFLLTLLFSFSIKAPSAHTFWIIFPLSFYPALRVLEEQGFFKTNLRLKQNLWSFALVCGVFFSVVGFTQSDYRPLHQVQAYSRQIHHGETELHEIPSNYRSAVRPLLRLHIQGASKN